MKKIPNIAVGPKAGERLLTGEGNILIGINAGADLTHENGVTIIGDNIRSLDHSQKDVMFIGLNLAIGKTLFNKELNLADIIKGIYK